MNSLYQATKLQKRTLLCIAISSIMLTACGGSGSPKQVKNETNPISTPKKPLGKYALKSSGSAAAFLAYYQKGINNGYNRSNNVAMPGMTASTASDASSSVGNNASVSTNNSDSTGKAEGNFGVSTTNLIEQGVDEADIAKQNQTHIFTIGRDVNDKGSLISVIKSFAKPSTVAVGRYELDNNNGLNGAFLAGKKLITLANKSQPSWYHANTLAYQNGKIQLVKFDISNPANITKSKTYEWDGYTKTSRRIGNDIYVISSSSVQNPWSCAYPTVTTDNATQANTAAARVGISLPYCGQPEPLTPEQIKERMPVDINGNKIKPEDCLIPNNYDKDSTYINGNITLVTKIDLNNDANHKTTCIAASAEHVYMNTKSLYLAGHNYKDGSSSTLINKFSLSGTDNGAVSYKGTGSVKGYINWNVMNFSMNEYKDVLRVVTSEQVNTANEQLNMLHTLKESANKVELTTLASLPNKEQPASIGKPKEEIKGVRFFGDQGYVVTFERTDPLYKIDLSDPTKPMIKGELEMPGYSAYLHRISDKYLLGVGYSMNEKGRRVGIQTTVFDISSDTPSIVSQKTITKDNPTWFQLPVDQDSRAIMTLKNNNTMRIAIPYQRNVNTLLYENNLQTVEYEVNLTTGSLAETQTRYLGQSLYGGNYMRPLLDGNNIFYNYVNGGLSHFQWNNNALISTSRPLYSRNISTYNTKGDNVVASGIISTQADYDKLKETVSNLPKEIDFNRYRVVVFSTEKKEDITIQQITQNANVLTAQVLTQVCETGQRLPQTKAPTHLVYLVESNATAVNFEQKTKTKPCR